MESYTLLDKIKERNGLGKVDIRTYSPLSLAYIGDAVYDMVVRSIFTAGGNIPNGKLHKETTSYVSAVSQSKIVDLIMDDLTEEEISIYKRGKNAKPSSSAKNASQKEYLKATGFEALLGYLYLKNDDDRMLDLIYLGMTRLKEK